MALRKSKTSMTTVKGQKVKATLAAASEIDGPSEDNFSKRVLHEINLVRADPLSIIEALREQMNYVDEESVLSVPNREPIQLEEGQSAYLEAIE